MFMLNMHEQIFILYCTIKYIAYNFNNSTTIRIYLYHLRIVLFLTFIDLTLKIKYTFHICLLFCVGPSFHEKRVRCILIKLLIQYKYI